MLYTTTLSSVIPALLLLAENAAGAGLNCAHARADGVKWDFSQLDGPHALSWAHKHKSGSSERVYNTTFTLDICNKLKDTPCSTGSHVCAVDDLIDDTGKVLESEHEIYDVAGDYLGKGINTDHKWTRLKNSESHEDANKHGVRLLLNGAKYETIGQQASIEFICIEKQDERSSKNLVARQDRARDDDEDDSDGDDSDEAGGDDDSGDDDDHHTGGSHDNLDEDHPDWAKYRETDDGKDGTIKFLSYSVQGSHKVLRLEWKTPYACEDAADDADLHDGDSKSGGWGFFGWFFFLAFMGILVYFVFFAWINYSRHGATGWDMLPHSDTIRDLPYILGDWGRRVVGTVQGGNSRGGYSAL